MNQDLNVSPHAESYTGANGSIEARAGKFLTFHLAEEVFGIEILKVQEIIGIMKVTRVPSTLHFIRGVINLRGKVIPVVDLRLKFGMEAREDSEKTCIIVVQLADSAGNGRSMGVIVDEVYEVLDIKEEQIDAPLSFGAGVDNDFIPGLGKVGEKVVIILDIDRALNTEENEFSLAAA